MWIDLETVVPGEVSQRKKNKYPILTHVCEIQKNGTDDFTCRTEREIQTLRANLWIPKEERVGGMNWETEIDIYTLLYIKHNQ